MTHLAEQFVKIYERALSPARATSAARPVVTV